MLSYSLKQIGDMLNILIALFIIMEILWASYSVIKIKHHDWNDEVQMFILFNVGLLISAALIYIFKL